MCAGFYIVYRPTYVYPYVQAEGRNANHNNIEEITEGLEMDVIKQVKDFKLLPYKILQYSTC